MRGGQVSVEYMLVLGLVFLLLVPGGYLFYNYSQGSQDQILGAQLARAGTELINSVERMYAVGQNSWETIHINFPENVENVYVAGTSGTELVILHESSTGLSEAVFFSKVNMTTPYGGNVTQNFTPGLTKIRVTSQGGVVELRETT